MNSPRRSTCDLWRRARSISQRRSFATDPDTCLNVHSTGVVTTAASISPPVAAARSVLRRALWNLRGAMSIWPRSALNSLPPEELLPRIHDLGIIPFKRHAMFRARRGFRDPVDTALRNVGPEHRKSEEDEFKRKIYEGCSDTLDRTSETDPLLQAFSLGGRHRIRDHIVNCIWFFEMPLQSRDRTGPRRRAARSSVTVIIPWLLCSEVM